MLTDLCCAAPAPPQVLASTSTNPAFEGLQQKTIKSQVMPFAKTKLEAATLGGPQVDAAAALACNVVGAAGVGGARRTTGMARAGERCQPAGSYASEQLFIPPYPALVLQVLDVKLPFDEAALLRENQPYLLRCGCPWAGQLQFVFLSLRLGFAWLVGAPVERNARLCTHPCRSLKLEGLDIKLLTYAEQQACGADSWVAAAAPGTPGASFSA